MLTIAALVLALPLLVQADFLLGSDGQVILNGVADEHRHPEWPHRQAALGWHHPSHDQGDTVFPEIGGDVNSCGGVCVLTPESIEVRDLLPVPFPLVEAELTSMQGPFYLDKSLHRQNVTESRPGIPVELTMHLYQVSSYLSSKQPYSTCDPLSGAWMDIWSCDVEGRYSGYTNATGPMGGGRGAPGKGPGHDGHRGPKGPDGPRGSDGPGRGPGGMHVEPSTVRT